MSYWLRPDGHSTYGIGICSRCQKKFFIDQLYDDPNSPGLKVCGSSPGTNSCMDELDPYRLAPRPPDQITLLFTRPEEPVNTDAKPTPEAEP